MDGLVIFGGGSEQAMTCGVAPWGFATGKKEGVVVLKAGGAGSGRRQRNWSYTKVFAVAPQVLAALMEPAKEE